MTKLAMTTKPLSPKVAAEIAAGGVVGKPASVVKELVENSLDAGANQIAIETKGGGIEFIRVTDNGGGAGSIDVELVSSRYVSEQAHRHRADRRRRVDSLYGRQPPC